MQAVIRKVLKKCQYSFKINLYFNTEKTREKRGLAEMPNVYLQDVILVRDLRVF